MFGGLQVQWTLINTEICLFSRTNIPPVFIKISNQEVETKNQINVLGIIFDSNLQWGPQVTSTLKKANKALNAIKLIPNYFTSSELLQLVTSNFFSVLYDNSEVWHLKTLNQSMKSKLLSTSAKALKLCAKTPDMWMMSFPNLHKMAGRTTPDKMIDYKLALQLFRVVNYHIPTPDWINLNLNNIQTTKQTKLATQRTNRLKIGMNIFSNRLHYLNGKIELDWLNLSFGSYKVKCKKLFLQMTVNLHRPVLVTHSGNVN